MENLFRLMQKSDYESVYSLWMKCKNMGFNNVDDSEKGISKYLERNSKTCFVCVRNEKVVGVILSGHDGRRGFIHHLAVDPDCRRQGIATELLRQALNALKKEEISKVGLFVFAYNLDGNAFWEKQRFTLREDINYRNKALVDLIRQDT